MLTYLSRFSFGGAVFMLCAFCIAAVCIAAAKPVLAETGKRMTVTQTLNRRQAVALDVSGDLGGDVEVVGGNGQKLDLSAQGRGTFGDRVQMLKSSSAQMLRIGFALKPAAWSLQTMLHLHDTQVKVVLHVPKWANLSVNVVNGAIDITNVTGRLSVKIINGPITVSGAGSLLALHCTNGPVDADIIDISAVPDVDITTTNGPVDVRVPKGFRAAVDAQTVFGPVDNALPNSDGPGRMHLHAVTGPVSIELR